MTSDSFQLRCHHCSSWIGEARQAMEIVGMFRDPRERERIPGPRDSWRCKSCGWINVFRIVAARVASFRQVELKDVATK